jgi:hypothetical protein
MIAYCCDPDDCGPCCPNCPDCPTHNPGGTEQWVIRFVGTAAQLVADPNNLDDGAWLVDYDPDGNGGTGDWTFTTNRAEARRFPSAAAALECWRQPSTVLPTRPDGKPNRPLTGFTISADRVPS